IAYRQPLTRAEIESIRGVEVIAALETLVERGLVKVDGRKDTVGRPLLYATTPEFLRFFGFNSIEDMPKLETLVEKKPEPVETEEEAQQPQAPAPTEPENQQQLPLDEESQENTAEPADETSGNQADAETEK
ncbi:MAG TPA: SMC-Scp complex subunit ScpB, partial [Elusimicrobiales bacterium]|nr:SMC-Scp complex subunit ScpB [Elusimicrobiales bacterium]